MMSRKKTLEREKQLISRLPHYTILNAHIKNIARHEKEF